MMKIKLQLIKWQILLYIGLLICMTTGYILPNSSHDNRFMIIMAIMSLPTLLGGIISVLITKGYRQTSIAYLITLLVTSPFFFCIQEDTENLWLHLDLIYRATFSTFYSMIAYKIVHGNHQDIPNSQDANYSKFIRLCVIFTITIILCYMSIFCIFYATKNEVFIKPFANLRNLTCLINISLQIYFLLKEKYKWAFYTFVLVLLVGTFDSWYYDSYKEICLWIALSSIIYAITYLHKNTISNANLTLLAVDIIYIVSAFCIISLLNDYNQNLLILAEAFTLWIMILITNKHFALKSLVLCLLLVGNFMTVHFLSDSSLLLNKAFMVKYGSISGIVILGYLLVHASIFIEQKNN